MDTEGRKRKRTRKPKKRPKKKKEPEKEKEKKEPENCAAGDAACEERNKKLEEENKAEEEEDDDDEDELDPGNDLASTINLIKRGVEGEFNTSEKVAGAAKEMIDIAQGYLSGLDEPVGLIADIGC